ncbi:hypothetical protein STEG23_022974 [Scotinomys teguina]
MMKKANTAATQAQNKDYELVHPNIYLIYELLEQVKGMNLQIQNSSISTTQDNNRISKKGPNESLLSVVQQKPEASKPMNLMMNTCKETMAFFVKNMISNQVKNLGFGGGSEEKKEEGGTSDPAAAQGMTREEYEEYQKQMIEEKMERDAAFTQKKAERACLRVHLRDKYRLPKSEIDETQIQLAGDDVDLPEDLRKMVDEDQDEEEEKESILGQLQNLQNMDLDTIKEKAQATLTEIKQSAEQKCSVM